MMPDWSGKMEFGIMGSGKGRGEGLPCKRDGHACRKFFKEPLEGIRVSYQVRVPY